MDKLMVKMHLLLKAEMILFRLQLRHTLRQAAFYIAAALLGVLAVGMLNVALYLYLARSLDGSSAALAVAIADIVLAVVAIVVAGKLRHDPEVDTVRAVREAALATLTAESARVRTQITDLQDDIKRIRDAVTGFLRFGDIDLTSLFQWVPLLLRFLLRRKDR
jgi:cell division protein FtsB